jgi:glyceraldehyde-3-phosphate dehydrogenase (ferredoxin)
MAKAAREYGNTKWAEAFEKDTVSAAYEWWSRFYRKVNELVK